VRDYSAIAETHWYAAVLDEAQTIKNPDTRAAKAIRALGVRRRVALTGTPIENSVMDIWSIEEFLNPGFLGDRKTFRERFDKPLSLKSASLKRSEKLAHALEPFVMRRVKSDPEIAVELSAKEEIREYCTLTQAQRLEYEIALSEFRDGKHRHGDVFALLTRLKLICDGEGKLVRLIELLETIFENGESVLIFTQYVKTGRWLSEQLAKRFARKFPFLHGGLSVKEREFEINRFSQNPSRPDAFILSLRAGGFGLNLTKASHVIHFDRWWNPAVENQATDRAHRIGQDKTVFVHTFITEGTLEERIDEILQRKEDLAGILKGGSEFWDAVKLDE
jgi:SNF2 family DNA or RNA helicase